MVGGAPLLRAGAGLSRRQGDYIGSEKRILWRCIRERRIALTPAAKARLDAMPEKFQDFLVERADLAPVADSRRAA